MTTCPDAHVVVAGVVVGTGVVVVGSSVVVVVVGSGVVEVVGSCVVVVVVGSGVVEVVGSGVVVVVVGSGVVEVVGSAVVVVVGSGVVVVVWQVEAPTASENLPATQLMQVVAEYVPAAQLSHAALPIVALYVPAAHCLHHPNTPVYPSLHEQLFLSVLATGETELSGQDKHWSCEVSL